jgi:hypothetical protein
LRGQARTRPPRGPCAACAGCRLPTQTALQLVGCAPGYGGGGLGHSMVPEEASWASDSSTGGVSNSRQANVDAGQ